VARRTVVILASRRDGRVRTRVRVRWLVRYPLVGFAATTIVAWFAFGARFDLAYLSKAIELALIGLVLVESWVVDGGPLVVARRVERIAVAAIR
jgi:hypothetical protein